MHRSSAYKEQIEALKKQLETKQERLDERRDKILKNANEEAKRILAETKEYADQTMKLFHKFQKDHVDTAAVEKERQNIRARMNKADNALSIKAAPKEPKKKLTAKDLSLGDMVRVLSMNLNGTVSSRPDSKGFLFVQTGNHPFHRFIFQDLELVDEPVIYSPALHENRCRKDPHVQVLQCFHRDQSAWQNC